MLLIQIEPRKCIVGSPANEFVIVVFCFEGAGLVAMHYIVHFGRKKIQARKHLPDPFPSIKSNGCSLISYTYNFGRKLFFF